MEIYFTGVAITFFLVLWATGGKLMTAVISSFIWPLVILSPLLGLFFGLRKDK